MTSAPHSVIGCRVEPVLLPGHHSPFLAPPGALSDALVEILDST